MQSHKLHNKKSGKVALYKTVKRSKAGRLLHFSLHPVRGFHEESEEEGVREALFSGVKGGTGLRRRREDY